MVNVQRKRIKGVLIFLGAFCIFILCAVGGNLLLATSDRSPYISSNEWMRDYGREYRMNGQAILELPDGNLLIAGLTDCDYGWEYDSSGYYAMKVTPLGEVIWTRLYEGYLGHDHYLSAMIPLTMNQYLLVGGLTAHTAIAICIDKEGNLLWDRLFSGVLDHIIRGATNTPDGGAILVGNLYESDSNSHIWIHRIDNMGLSIWNTTADIADYERLSSVVTCSNGDFLAVGWTHLGSWSTGQSNALIVRFNETGSILWNQSISGSDNLRAEVIKYAHDSGFVVSGIQVPPDSPQSFFLMHIDEMGLQSWLHTYDYGSQSWFTDLAVCQFGYIIVGLGDSPNPHTHTGLAAIAIRVDETGNPLWNWNMGTSHSLPYFSNRVSVIAPQQGGFYLVFGSEVKDFGYYPITRMAMVLTRLPDPPTPTATFAQLLFSNFIFGSLAILFLNVWLSNRLSLNYTISDEVKKQLESFLSVNTILTFFLFLLYLAVAGGGSVFSIYASGPFFPYLFQVPASGGTYETFPTEMYRLMISPVFFASVFICIVGLSVLQLAITFLVEFKSEKKSRISASYWLPLIIFVIIVFIAFAMLLGLPVYYGNSLHQIVLVLFLPLIFAFMVSGMLPSVVFIQLRTLRQNTTQ
ncbi:MAG: hypothetical protein ACFFCH_02900 [Promethearchaeota archaeon]